MAAQNLDTFPFLGIPRRVGAGQLSPGTEAKEEQVLSPSMYQGCKNTDEAHNSHSESSQDSEPRRTDL